METLLKSESSTGVFLFILGIFLRIPVLQNTCERLRLTVDFFPRNIQKNWKIFKCLNEQIILVHIVPIAILREIATNLTEKL